MKDFMIYFILICSSILLFFGCNPSKPQKHNGIYATDGRYHDRIDISWDILDGAITYKVLRADDKQGAYSKEVCVVTQNSEKKCKDRDVVSQKQYWYKVQAIYENNKSVMSQPVSGYTKKKCAMPTKSKGQMMNIVKNLSSVSKDRNEALERINELPKPIGNPLIPTNEEIYRFVKDLCVTPHRRTGSPEGHRAEQYIYNTLKESGLTWVIKEPVENLDIYSADKWQILIRDGQKKIDYPCFYVVNTGFTPREGVSGSMVYIGDGTEKDFNKAGDLHGKIAVGRCSFPDFPIGILRLAGCFFWTSDPNNTIGLFDRLRFTFARSNFPPQHNPEAEPDPESIYWQAHKRGAIGLVIILSNHPGDTNTSWGPYDGIMKPMPAFYVSSYKGKEMIRLAKSGAMATLVLNGSLNKGVAHNIIGYLAGRSKETIMISTHHDSAHQGATEDGTGCAAVLSLAKAWANVPNNLREKSIIFVIATGHLYRGIGADEFAAKHKMDILDNVIVNINIEHISAKDVDNERPDLPANDHKNAISFMFISNDNDARSISIRALQKYKPDRVICAPGWLLGDVPPGEAGHYHIAADTTYIHYIGAPTYVLTAEDTLDKVDVKSLNKNVSMISDMVGSYMAK